MLTAVNRHGVLPSNFIYALDPGSPEVSKRNLQYLKGNTALYLPPQQREAENAWWTYHTYAIAPKGKAVGDAPRNVEIERAALLALSR